MSDFRVTGADDFLKVSKALKAMGATEVRKELNKALVDAAKPLIKDTRAAALAKLPTSGGLAKRMSKAPQRVRVRTGNKNAGVAIVLPGKQPGFLTGEIRRPVFGRKNAAGGRVMVTQQINGDWFDGTLDAGAARVLPEMEKAVLRIAAKIAGGL